MVRDDSDRERLRPQVCGDVTETELDRVLVVVKNIVSKNDLEGFPLRNVL